MMGAENIKQIQCVGIATGAKEDPRDAARLPLSGAHSAAVSVCGYRGPSLQNSIMQNVQANRCVVESVGALLNA